MPTSSGEYEVVPVTLPPGRARLSMSPASPAWTITMGMVAVACRAATRGCSRYRNDYVDRERDEFSCQRGQPFQLAFGLTLLSCRRHSLAPPSFALYRQTRSFVHDKQANARELSLLRACRRGPPRRGCEPKPRPPAFSLDHLVGAGEQS